MPPTPPVSFFLAARYIFCDRRLSFCIAYFLTSLQKVCKWQVSVTFRCRAMTLFSNSCRPCSQGHVTAHLMQMLTVVDLFSCFSTYMIHLAIHDDLNGYSNESSTTAER